MKKIKNIFIKIDEFIFSKIDFLKGDPSFQKITDFLLTLSEEQQKIIAQIITFSFIIIPYLLVAIYWWKIHITRVNLETKSQIIEEINNLSAIKNNKTYLSSVYLAPEIIGSSEDLDQKIKNLSAGSEIEPSKIKTLNFKSIASSASLSKIEAMVSFQDFGTKDLANFVRALVEQEKFKIFEINLTKNNTTNLLNGELSLIHIGRNSDQ